LLSFFFFFFFFFFFVLLRFHLIDSLALALDSRIGRIWRRLVLLIRRFVRLTSRIIDRTYITVSITRLMVFCIKWLAVLALRIASLISEVLTRVAFQMYQFFVDRFYRCCAMEREYYVTRRICTSESVWLLREAPFRH
jgi:hypothetical protein